MNKITVPISLELNKGLAWCIGFYFAEGCKTLNYIGASNCNLDLIKKFRDTMEEVFKINRSQWKVHIKTSNKDLEFVESKWKQLLDIDCVNVLYNELSNDDNVELRFNSREFARFFNTYIKESLAFIFCENELILEFLKGYEAGDGSIMRSHDFLKGISIVTKSSYNLKILLAFFHKIYHFTPNFRMSKGSYEIYIKNVKLMTRFIIDGHFSDHKDKWRIFIKSYLCKQYTRSHMRYWKILEEGPRNISDIAELSNRSHWSVRDALREDFKLELLEVLSKKPKIYNLSKKGERLLSILKGVDV